MAIISTLNIFALREFQVPPGQATVALTQGLHAPGDGGNGTYWLDGNDKTTIDDGSAVLTANISGGGRWKLLSGATSAGLAASNVAALRALVVPSTASLIVATQGYYAPGDGGDARYWYDATDSSSTDNGGSVITASSGKRWKLIPNADGKTRSRQWGAKGDGTTNDTTAVKNAFAYARDTSVSHVLVIGGTCMVDSGQLEIATGKQIVLEGESEDAIGGTMSMLQVRASAGSNYLFYTAGHVTVRNLVLHANDIATRCVFMEGGTTNSEFTHVYFTHATGPGIEAKNTENTKFYRCWATNNGAQGFLIKGGNTVVLKDVVVQNNGSAQIECQGSGFGFDATLDAGSIWIENPLIEPGSSGATSIYLRGCGLARIRGGYAEPGDADCIWLEKCYNTIISQFECTAGGTTRKAYKVYDCFTTIIENSVAANGAGGWLPEIHWKNNGPGTTGYVPIVNNCYLGSQIANASALAIVVD